MFLQVYDVLEKNFADCTWPVPPSAILLHLPIKEQKEKGLNSEAILRSVITRDRSAKYGSTWDIRPVEVRPEWT